MKNLKKKFLCPHCYKEHTFLECTWRCSYYSAEPGEKCYANVNKDYYGWISDEDKKFCSACKKARIRLSCPKHGEIPYCYYNADKTFLFSLIGNSCNGKSTYLSVLVPEMKKLLEPSFDCIVNSQESYENSWYGYSWKRRELMPATRPPKEQQLMLPITFFERKKGKRKQTALAFDDYYGYFMESVDDFITSWEGAFGRGVVNSNGILLFLDPLLWPKIRKQLEGKMVLPYERDEIQILQNLVEVFLKVKGTKGKIDVPIAVVVMKMDVIFAEQILDEDRITNKHTESIYSGGVVESEFNLVAEEMKNFIRRYLGEEAFQYLNMFEKVSYFGVSALGAEPVQGSFPLDGAQPKRVLDPLLWLLAEQKIIKKVKK